MGKDFEAKKISIGLGFGIFCLYAAWIWLCDANDLLCYLTGIAQCTIASRLLITALLGFAVYLMRGQFALRKCRKDTLYYVLSAVILLFAIHKGIIADTAADTKNYHVILQQPGYIDALHDHMMPADFQMYGFRWVDRMFYGFRAVLGYRMGTVFTGVVALLIYAQIRELLQAVAGRQLQLCCSRLPKGLRWLFGESLLAFSVTMVSELVIQQGSYMIDTVAVPFAVEALYLLLTRWDRPQNALQMVWFALLNGCYFAGKMTHVVYVVPLILLYLLVHRKEVTGKRFGTAFVIALIPVSIYLIYNYTDTGNPVFPYFNGIFQSPYFAASNFKDTRWGPSDLKELILWPYYSNTNPYYRLSEVPNQFALGTTMYMVMTGLCVPAILLRKKKDRLMSCFLLVFVVVSFYLWAGTTGHSRYYLFGYIVTGLLVVELLAWFFAQGYKGIGWLVCLPMAVLLMQPWVLMESVSGGYEYSWRDSRDAETVSAHLEYVLRDQNAAVEMTQDIPAPDLLLINRNALGSVAHLLYPDTPIVFNSYLISKVSQAVQEEHRANIQQALETGVVYEPHLAYGNATDWKEYMERLNSLGLQAEMIYWPETIFDATDDVLLVHLTAQEAEETNCVLYANEPEDTLTAQGADVRLQAVVTMNQWYAVGEDVTFSVIASDGAQERVVYTQVIDMRETLQLDAMLDLSGFAGGVTLRFESSAGGPENAYWQPQCLVLNPVVEG